MKTNNYLFLSLCLCIPLFALTGCDNDSFGEPFGTDTERYDIPLDTKSLEVNARGQKFAFNFYKEMAGKEESNFCISPLSASFCLGMVLNGANGNTYTELQEALGYEGLTNEEINAYAQMMQTELPKLDGRTIFMNANSMWIKDDFQMLEPFVKTNQTYYNAEVYNEPFNMETVDKINHWCANKTNDLIPKMLETISPNTLACLINAIYFKGVWKMEFDKGDTRDKPFHLKDGSEIKVPTMKQQATNYYYGDEQVSVVELPYGNGAFSLVLFMPSDKKKTSLDELIADLDADRWNQWMRNLSSYSFDLYLPRFTMESSMDLTDVMRTLGVKDAFKSEADFTNISAEQPLFIGLIKQNTFIKVDESGTEAAAVTIVGMDTMALPLATTLKELRFDHPFGYVLKENSTGAILFAGRVDHPKS